VAAGGFVFVSQVRVENSIMDGSSCLLCVMFEACGGVGCCRIVNAGCTGKIFV
jgi:hypothetical protein